MIEAQGQFYVIPDETRMDPARNSDAWQDAEKLQAILSEIFPVPCSYSVCQPGEYTGCTIIDRLVDTKITRIGEAPFGAARQQLEEQANKIVGTGMPIAMVGIYGTPRHLDHPDLNTAQLSDMAAVMMVQAALDRIHSAHESGAFFNLVDENLTALWLDIAQHPEGAAGRGRFKQIYLKYLQDRRRLIVALEGIGMINTGNTKIELLSESELYSQIWQRVGPTEGQYEDDFLAKCEASRPVILSYLVASGEVFEAIYGDNDQAWPSSEENPDLWRQCMKVISECTEYNKLKEIGWQGLIPPEMRRYYLQKFRDILGDDSLAASDQLLLYHVATYLASTLEKYKAGTLTEGISKDTPVLKVPLVKPVDGRPLSHLALVPQRTIPKPTGSRRKRISSDNKPAWSSMAVFANEKLRLISPDEFINTPQELVVPAQIYNIGADNGVGSFLADTAIILNPINQ